MNSPKVLVKSEWNLREVSRWEVRGRKQSHSMWSAASHSESLSPPEFREENMPPSSFLHNPLKGSPAQCPHSCGLQHISILAKKSIKWGIRELEYVSKDKRAVIHWHVLLAQPRILYCIFYGKQNWHPTNSSSCELIDCSYTLRRAHWKKHS